MNPLLRKELRENVRWLPLGLTVVGFACWIAPPDPSNSGGLLASDLLMQLAIVVPLLAFALGVVQSYRDLQPGPAGYLNHRGVTASQIFLTKTLAGFVLYWISIIIPVAILAAWVWYEGMARYPMRPAQVIPSLVFALATFAMHPAAMLMMTRNASWWGTRLLPLIPAGALLIWFFAALESGGLWWAVVILMLSVPMLAWLVAISRGSWRDLATDPPASRTNASLRERWLLPTYLFLGVSIGFVTALAFIVNTTESYSRRVSDPTPFHHLVLDKKTGEPWLTTRLQNYDSITHATRQDVLGGDAIKSGAIVDAMKRLDDPTRMRLFSGIGPLTAFGPSSDGFFTPASFINGNLSVSYDERGYLHLYDSHFEHGSLGTIATDGIYSPGDLSGVPFTSDPLAGGYVVPQFEDGRFKYLMDSQGVYVLGISPLSITPLIDQAIESAGMVYREQAPRLLLRSGLEIFEYQTVDGSGADTRFRIRNLQQEKNHGANHKSNSGLAISAKLINTFAVPSALASSSNLEVALFDNTLFLAAFPDDLSRRNHDKVLYRVSASGKFEKIMYQSIPLPKIDSKNDGFLWGVILLGFTPGIVGIIILAQALLFFITGSADATSWDAIAANPILNTTIFLAFCAVTILAIWLTQRVAYRRGLSRVQTIAWSVTVLMLGLIAPLSMVAIYRRVQREECSQCGKERRVDTDTCEHCGESWQRPTVQGILILDDAA